MDGRTFDCVWDRGYSDYSERRFQLQDVELPNTRFLRQRVARRELTQEQADELLIRFDRARLCLSLILLGERALVEIPEGTPEDAVAEDARCGRKILLSTLRPNKYGRGSVRAYVEARRGSFSYTQVGHTVAGHHFLDVNRLMYKLAQADEGNYSLERLKEVLLDFEPMDLTL